MSSKSTVYLSDHSESVLRSHKWRTATNSAGYLLDSLLPHHLILDIGCGPGTITIDFAKLVPQGQVVGLDFVEDPLNQARAHAVESGVDNIRFAVGDIQALDFPDNTFDVVHCHQVLQHVADPIQALREMRRVTKPGGVVAARESDFSIMTWFPEVEGLKDWQGLYLQMARAKGGEPNAGRRLHAWAHQAGFERSAIKATTSTWCYNTPQERAWWSGLWADRTVAASYVKTAVEGKYATEEELTHIAEAWRHWGADEDGWFVMLHGEVLCRV